VTIVAVGGSHVAQWLRALSAAGSAHGYRIVAMTKDDCTFTTEPFRHASCTSWNRKAMREIIKLKPDLVLAIATRIERRGDFYNDEMFDEGYRAAFATLGEAGIHVLGLRDNPWFGADVAQCVSVFRPDWERCGQEQGNVMGEKSPLAGVTMPNVHFADISDVYCVDGFCPAVKNGILVYRDRHHVTGTFALLQKDRLAAEIAAALADR
jgi:hypothetical protein